MVKTISILIGAIILLIGLFLFSLAFIISWLFMPIGLIIFVIGFNFISFTIKNVSND